MYLPSQDDVWFLPIGGADEIGMNLNLIGHDQQWLVLDCGVTFFDRYGIDIITPDPTFLKQHASSIVAFIITHAHEDHIGAIPYLWPYVKCPIYATAFTRTIIEGKIAEFPWKKEVVFKDITVGTPFQVGVFNIEFISVTHSIPESNVVVVETPLGRILHTGDWKLDPEPLVGKETNTQRIREIGDKGVLALICDSTNVFCEGHSGSEGDVRHEILRLIQGYPDKRLTVCCFASNIARLETIALAAQQCGRKVALIGRSLDRMSKAARACGYLQEVSNFIDIEEAIALPHSRVLFISTGSQGEFRAALSRISADQHPLHLGTNDVVIFSSRVIPGNEKNISIVQNRLVRKGVEIITSQDEPIHVSGHPARDELTSMYEWVKPYIVIPVHGEARHLKEQADLALSLGVPKVVIPENGSLIDLYPENPHIMEVLPTIRFMWDGNRLISSKSRILSERQKLSMQGIVCISFLFDRSQKNARNVQVTGLGICEPGEEMDKLHHLCKQALSRALHEWAQEGPESNQENIIRKVIRQSVFYAFRKKPFVEVHAL